MIASIIVFLIGLVFLVIIVPAVLFGSWYTVDQQTVRFVERFGKFQRIGRAGLNFKIPFIESLSDGFSLRVQELKIETETKTLDNVFIYLAISVFYSPVTTSDDDLYSGYYKFSNVSDQLVAYVNDAVRSRVPSLNLDDVFAQKGDIGAGITEQLGTEISGYGYKISSVLITDIRPDEKVQEAMNEINASKRLQEAAVNTAEAQKITIVKAAEAEAEAKELQGVGIANQRKAIVNGLRESTEDLVKATGQSPDEVMTFVLLTQYFDTIKSVGESDNAKSIFLPSSPAGMSQIAAEIRTAVLTAKE